MGAARRGNAGNRGRGAAAGNRRALLAAAVEVFGERGYDAPLSAVARRAGVGQGSLYRHFPDRHSLARAVFEDNLAPVEQLAAQPGSTLDDVLGLLTRQAIESVAFVAMVTDGGEPALTAVAQRVREALAGPLRQALEAGAVRPSVTVDDVMLGLGMVASILAKTPADTREATAASAWALLRTGLCP